MWPLKSKTMYEIFVDAIELGRKIPRIDKTQLAQLKREINKRNDQDESLLDLLFRHENETQILNIISNKSLLSILSLESGKRTLTEHILASGNAHYFRVAIHQGEGIDFTMLPLLVAAHKDGIKDVLEGVRKIIKYKDIDAVKEKQFYLKLLLQSYGDEVSFEDDTISNEKFTECYLAALESGDSLYINTLTLLALEKDIEFSKNCTGKIASLIGDRLENSSASVYEVLCCKKLCGKKDAAKINLGLRKMKLEQILQNSDYFVLFCEEDAKILLEKINEYASEKDADLNSIVPLLLRIKEELPDIYAQIDIPAEKFDLNFIAHPDHAELYELWAPKVGLYGYKGQLIVDESSENKESRCFAQLRKAIQSNELPAEDFRTQYLDPERYSRVLNMTLYGGVVGRLNRGNALSIIDFAFDNNNPEYTKAILESSAFDPNVCGRRTALQYILEPSYGGEFDVDLLRIALRQGASLTQFICQDRGDPQQSLTNLLSVKGQFENDLAFRVALRYADSEIKFDNHYAEQKEADKLVREAIKFGDERFVGILAEELKSSGVSVEVNLSKELNDRLKKFVSATISERETLIREIKSLIVLASDAEKIDAITISKLLRVKDTEDYVELLLRRDPSLAYSQYSFDHQNTGSNTINFIQEIAVAYQHEGDQYRKDKLVRILASELSKPEQVKKLLENVDDKGNNIFHYLFFAGIKFDGLNEILLANKAGLKVPNEAGFNSLEIAVMAGNSDFLLGFRDLDIYDFEDPDLHLFNTVVDEYCAKPSDKLNILLQSCKKEQSVLAGQNGVSTLMIAASYHNQEVFNLLKPTQNYDAICKQTDDNGYGILHYACLGNVFKQEFAQQLIQSVGINHQDKTKPGSLGMTPLMVAAKTQKDMLEFLCSKDDLDVNLQDKNGYTALIHAVEAGNIANVRKLLAMGDIDLNKKDKNGCTALMHAVALDNSVMVALLLQDPRLEVNETNKLGVNALQLALMSVEDRSAIIQGKNPDASGGDQTYANMKMVEDLISNGAKVPYKNNSNLLVSLVRIRIISAIISGVVQAVAAPLTIMGFSANSIIEPVRRVMEGGAVYGRVHDAVRTSLTRMLSREPALNLSALDPVGCYAVSNWGFVTSGQELNFQAILGDQHRVRGPGDASVISRLASSITLGSAPAVQEEVSKLAEHRRLIHRDREICKVLNKVFVWPWTKRALRKVRAELIKRDNQFIVPAYDEYQKIFKSHNLASLARFIKFGESTDAQNLRNLTNQIVCGKVVADLETTRMAFALFEKIKREKKREDLTISFAYNLPDDDVLNKRLIDNIVKAEPSESPTPEVSGYAMRVAQAAIPVVSNVVAAGAAYANDIFRRPSDLAAGGALLISSGGVLASAAATVATTAGAVLLSTPVLAAGVAYLSYRIGSYAYSSMSGSTGEIVPLPTAEVSGMFNAYTNRQPLEGVRGHMEIGGSAHGIEWGV